MQVDLAEHASPYHSSTVGHAFDFEGCGDSSERMFYVRMAPQQSALV